MKKISIEINNIQCFAQLNNTRSAEIIYNSLPFKAKAQIWGNEIYFTIPVNIAQETNATEELEVGDLAFWPPGSAFCIFFGKTPASTGNKPRAASLVNVFGKIEGETGWLKNVLPGSPVKIDKI